VSYDPLSHSRHNGEDRSRKLGHEIIHSSVISSFILKFPWCPHRRFRLSINSTE